jgi:hypothetical protein
VVNRKVPAGNHSGDPVDRLSAFGVRYTRLVNARFALASLGTRVSRIAFPFNGISANRYYKSRTLEFYSEWFLPCFTCDNSGCFFLQILLSGFAG